MLAWLYASRALIFLGLYLIRDQPVVIHGGRRCSGGVSMAGHGGDELGAHRRDLRPPVGGLGLRHDVPRPPGRRGIGSWLSGALYEKTGGYGAAFVVNSALLLIAGLLSITLNERRLVPQLAPVAGGR
jgi:hypothetical protein